VSVRRKRRRRHSWEGRKEEENLVLELKGTQKTRTKLNLV
jgi:hypothetical protein